MGVRTLPGQAPREAVKLNDFMLAQELEERARSGRQIHLTAETAMRLVKAMRWKIAYESGLQGHYHLDSWETERAIRGQLKKNFGVLNNYQAAMGAFERVIQHFSKDHITCREKSRVVAEHNAPLKPPP
jgi:hypothetical protein